MSFLTWPTVSTSPAIIAAKDDQPPPPSSTALNLLAALPNAHIPFYNPTGLGLIDRHVRLGGTGGHSTIEVGQTKELGAIAVKRGRLLPKIGYSSASGTSAFDKNLAQIVLELRILTHRHLSAHPNIINCLGICSGGGDDLTSFALVLEYSPFGDLRSFLAGSDNINAETLGPDDLTGLIAQVGQGLVALHTAGVAHCDIKTENVLMFSQNGKWQPKICDFGQSLVAPRNNPTAKLQGHYGTPLLNAPELRNRAAYLDPNFDIHAALRTDVFSYGLLAWEVLNRGERFFKTWWAGPELAVEDMETVLKQLPQDRLAEYGVQFLETLNLEPSLEQRLRLVFQACLADDPLRRKSLAEVLEVFGKDKSHQVSLDVASSLDDLIGNGDPTVTMWTTRQSLDEDSSLHRGEQIRKACIDNLVAMDLIPQTLKHRIVEELKAMASSKAVDDQLRAHSALTVSESYTVGFGSDHDSVEALRWLYLAAQHGSLKAISWYPRVCHALNLEPEDLPATEEIRLLERSLSSLPPTDYFAERIIRWNANNRDNIRNLATSVSSSHEGVMFRMAIFSDDIVDDLSPSLLAAYLGDIEAVSRAIEAGLTNARSSLGFSMGHYACLGGHIDVLRQLTCNSSCLTEAPANGITPLHLTVFFPQSDVKDAVRILLADDPSVDAQSDDIKWDAHNISVSGTPLEWATATRNRRLVKALAPYCSMPVLQDSLRVAISSFFWEIAEELIAFLGDPGRARGLDVWTAGCTAGQYSHWMAHGREYQEAIVKTVHLWKRQGLQGRIMELSLGDSEPLSSLDLLVGSGATDAEIRVICAILSVSSPDYVKEYPAESWPPICAVMERCKHDSAWNPVLNSILAFYTAQELDTMEFYGRNPLTFAVSRNCLYPTKALLLKGVDVNHAPAGGSFCDGSSAIHAWLGSGSFDMLKLLIDAGADPQTVHPLTGTTIFHDLVTDPFRIETLKRLLKATAENPTVITNDENVFSDILHFLLDRMPMRGSQEWNAFTSRSTAFQTFLTQPAARAQVNKPDKQHGLTLLHKAAFFADLEIVRLLLDAGADAGIPYTPPRDHAIPLFPLRIVCIQAWVFQQKEVQGHFDKSGSSRRKVLADVHDLLSQAKEVAKELTRWHTARGDGLFEGVSELHIACACGDGAELESIRRNDSGLECASGDLFKDQKEVCFWPDRDRLLTAEALLNPLVRQDEFDALLEIPEFWEQRAVNRVRNM